MSKRKCDATKNLIVLRKHKNNILTETFRDFSKIKFGLLWSYSNSHRLKNIHLSIFKRWLSTIVISSKWSNSLKKNPNFLLGSTSCKQRRNGRHLERHHFRTVQYFDLLCLSGFSSLPSSHVRFPHFIAPLTSLPPFIARIPHRYTGADPEIFSRGGPTLSNCGSAHIWKITIFFNFY